MNQEKKYTLQRLKDYALWYYFRYYPSNWKLLQKLEEKGTNKDAQKIFWEIKNLLQEDEIIKAKIDTYIFRNKNYRYIRQKMREKLFPTDKTEVYLEKYINAWESILDENFLRKKIENYTQKGKSRYYIFQTLWETKQDREKLEVLLDEYFPDWESENILREYEKLSQHLTPNHSPEKRGELPRDQIQKITRKLIAKWFKYDEIKRVLDF